MNKGKAFWYELRRIAFSKIYIVLLLLIALYGVYLLQTSVMQGTANTAPFSPWSFTSYLYGLSPLLAAVLLFYTAQLFSPHEQRVRHISGVTSLSGPVYFAIKFLAIATAWLLAVLLGCGICFIFYSWVFQFYSLHALIPCILLSLVPQMLLLAGTGVWLGRIHHTLCYLLIALVLFISATNIYLPWFLDPFGTSLLSIPMGLIPDKGYIPFDVPSGYIASRVLFAAIGLVLIIVACLTDHQLQRSKA